MLGLKRPHLIRRKLQTLPLLSSTILQKPNNEDNSAYDQPTELYIIFGVHMDFAPNVVPHRSDTLVSPYPLKAISWMGMSRRIACKQAPTSMAARPSWFGQPVLNSRPSICFRRSATL
jgi:hypothetical protein